MHVGKRSVDLNAQIGDSDQRFDRLQRSGVTMKNQMNLNKTKRNQKILQLQYTHKIFKLAWKRESNWPCENKDTSPKNVWPEIFQRAHAFVQTIILQQYWKDIILLYQSRADKIPEKFKETQSLFCTCARFWSLDKRSRIRFASSSVNFGFALKLPRIKD